MRTRFRMVVTVMVLAAATASCASSGDDAPTAGSSRSTAAMPANCAGTGSVAHRDLRYASTPGVVPALQSLDLHLPVVPDGCPATPLVVYVHGGGFRRGDKANQLSDKINLFTQRGWALASLNYRLVGNVGSGTTDGRYPAAEQDVAAAIAYLARHAGQYHLDARKMLLLGHSAGANLVALVSTDGSFLEQAGIPLDDVACTAPLDTTYDIPTQIARGGANARMYESAFGTDPQVWDQGSPSQNVAAGKGIPSFHIVTRGAPTRVAEAEAFGQVLTKAGVRADVQNVTGLTHEQVNAAVGAPGDTRVTPALMAFFSSCVTR